MPVTGANSRPAKPPVVNASTTPPTESIRKPLAGLPTAKDHCKHGGWQSFGVFKNQGDCVSFVATKGKNPPAKSP